VDGTRAASTTPWRGVGVQRFHWLVNQSVGEGDGGRSNTLGFGVVEGGGDCGDAGAGDGGAGHHDDCGGGGVGRRHGATTR
jgi:hypothetical protein